MPTPFIVGITGHPAAGKDMASHYFESEGFIHISCGDFLREQMKENNIPTDRAHMREFVKEMRTAYGNQYPAKEIIAGIRSNAVVSGFRNITEIETFRKAFDGNFILIAIDASLEVRYGRIHARGRHGDDISFEQFKIEEDKERREASGSHEMDKVIENADVIIENNGTKEELFATLKKASLVGQ
jgi:dephospho-CoA kinase